MIEQKKIKEKSEIERQKRLLEAKKNFEEIQAQITPFIRPKKIGRGYSTVGRWCEDLILCEK